MANSDSDQSAVIAFLSEPASYGAGVARVERCETHGAIVFLAGDRAYKLKRAVRYPYMDFSTVERRRAMCEAELKVNRRAAPALYLEVRALVRDAKGNVRFGTAADDDAALDSVVVMRRFDQANLLEAMRKRGALTPAILRQATEAIADFHRSAEISRSFGGAAGILRVIDENAGVLASFAGRPFAHEKIAELDRRAREALAALSPLLEQRRGDGFVRRCHGDLHLNNICLIDGAPVLFDAIEFNEEFSCIDVFYDLAFLLMDLEHRRLRGLANAVLNRYLERSGDFEGVALLPLLLSCRAAVRAHVTAALAEKLPEDARAPVLDDAATLLGDAIAFLKPAPPRLIVLGGLSGTGKSTLARALAPKLGRAPGAVILRSDVTRKQLHGAGELTRLPENAYAMETTVRVFAAIAERSATLLAGGQSVIADAVYGLPEERREIEAAARRTGANFQAVWLEAPLAVLEQRVAARSGDASDATVEVVRRQSATITAPDDWARVDVSGTEEQALARVVQALKV